MGISAIGRAIVEMASGEVAVIIRADGDLRLNVPDISAMTAPAPSPVAAVGGNGHNQCNSQNGAEQTSCQTIPFPHHRIHSFLVRPRRAVVILYIILLPAGICKAKNGSCAPVFKGPLLSGF